MKMKKSPNFGPDPFRGLTPELGSVIVWRDSAGSVLTASADSRCLEIGFDSVQRSRAPLKYQHRRNYEGFYQCAGTGQSIWYESMTEYTALMGLDHQHQHQLAGIAAQPFCILFPSGMRHYPDFFALHESGSQSVYDVRPAELIDDKTAEQFARTRTVCDQVGWGYEILHGVTGVPRHNLEWLAAYRHPYNKPGEPLVARILNAASVSKPLAELAVSVDHELPVRSLPGIYHLLWTRRLEYDETIPLSWATMIGRTSHG